MQLQGFIQDHSAVHEIFLSHPKRMLQQVKLPHRRHLLNPNLEVIYIQLFSVSSHQQIIRLLEPVHFLGDLSQQIKLLLKIVLDLFCVVK